ncbi:MAG: hypothetical protein ACE5FI_08755 [Anaerolineales bacterium]
MAVVDYSGKFYLGRRVASGSGKATDEAYTYDPIDLTTHAFVVGMTGSGKTGLCIDLMEEAALNNLPALLIDPKGDITNLLLHFPDQSAADFEPWIDPDAARREDKTVSQAAADTAALWKNGLADWGIGADRLQKLSDSASFAVYSPGSESGLPVSILASLRVPGIPWAGNEEVLRERITGTVTAILGLAGLTDIDPVTAREHILLANIFERAWSQGADLDLGELILQTQTPPFEKLGVFDIEQFFPQKERFELAMRLNNILAAPSFQAWVQGEPLDIQTLLYTSDGRPRHSIFYIAHLSESERMFFVTLLFSAVETWMRAQSGSTSLRALVYFDEIFGYLPPVANPPSKEPMLRLLKQARAFGVGLVLATQNPVDVDYKAISNVGTWFIGKLQTDQDRDRLLDGLTSAAAGFDRAKAEQLISSLGKRVFLAHNVHEKKPALFQTRWAMSYLAGPLTRNQLADLNALVGATGGAGGSRTAVREARPVSSGAAAPLEAEPIDPLAAYSKTRPAVPSGLQEYFLPNNLTLSEAMKSAGRSESAAVARPFGLIYKPGLLAQATARFLDRKHDIDAQQVVTAFVPDPDKRGMVRWEDFSARGVDARNLPRATAANASFDELDALLTDAKKVRPLEKDFVDYIYNSAALTLMSNPKLGVVAKPGTSRAQFRQMCSEAAREAYDNAADKLSEKFEKKIDRIKDKLAREERELSEDEAELRARKIEEFAKHGETLLNLISGRRSRSGVSSSLSKRRMTAKAKADVEESLEAIEEYSEDLKELQAELEEALEDLNDQWADVAEEIEELRITPLKKNISVDLFGVAWQPHWLVEIDGEVVELPAFG